MKDQTFDDVLGEIPKEAPKAGMFKTFTAWMEKGAEQGYDAEESLALMIGHVQESDQLRPFIPLIQLWFERGRQQK